MSIFGVKRENVQEMRRKQTLQTLKERKREAKEQKRLEEMERRKKKLLAEGSLYEAKARRKTAKKKASFQWPGVKMPKVQLRKKRQGRRLSKRRRIGLI